MVQVQNKTYKFVLHYLKFVCPLFVQAKIPKNHKCSQNDIESKMKLIIFWYEMLQICFCDKEV